MPVKEVILLGNPLLRENSEKVTDFNEIKPILLDLKDTLTYAQKTYGMGRGIAAPQLGYLKKIVYIQKPERSFYLVNPEITCRSKETFDVWDSCFSLLVSFFVKITRNKKIKIRYQNEFGESKIEEFKDDMSELLQHEIDHLEGVICSDYLQDPNDIVLKKEWEKRYRTPGIGM
jgi:peptide deformylase